MSIGQLCTGRRWFEHLVVLVTVLTLLTACSGGNQSQPTPTPASSTSGSSRMVPFSLGIPTAALNSPVVGNLSPNTPLHVVVTFKPNDALINSIGAKKLKGTPTIDASTLANKLGITDQQYAEVKKFFGINGISLKLSKLHTTLTLDAPASTFANLLQTTFVYRQYQGRRFYAPARTILLPQAIVSYILAISGLDNYSRPPQLPSLFNTGGSLTQVASSSCSPLPTTDSWAQISSIYDLRPFYREGWQGQGTTIILPEIDAFPVSDLQHYMSCVGFRGTVHVVTLNNNPPTQVEGEALLDLEMVAGLAPAANIVVYQESPGSDGSQAWSALYDELTQIENDYTKISGPTEISMSIGAPEDLQTVGLVHAFDTQLRILNEVENINTFVSSGDCGAFTNYQGYPNYPDTSFPATDPSVIAVGGTALKANGLARASEVVWQGNPKKPTDCEHLWGSGGGLSQAFPLPSWQAGPGVRNKYSDGNRQIPDVAADAWTVSFYVNGRWSWNGGTSAAAPIWASTYALINQGLVAQTRTMITGGPWIFYTLAQKESARHPFYSITRGNNLYYPATPGWNFAAGWGAPDAVGIYNGVVTLIQSSQGNG
jgi:subtilase family serine protease